TWKIAVLRYNEKRTLEEWLKEARGSDRLSAQELVYAGNFTWEAQRLSRSQRRALLKKSKNGKKQRGGTTESTT
ncbi:MAG: hypothetical protein LC650_04625, partial [Actinobacteria bacterium]|nr:hypothetical protein [Actinomycetota bacterium]